MIIDRNIEKYVIHHESSLREALERISTSKGRILLGVDQHNHLVGILTNGDLIHWLSNLSTTIDINTPIKNILNRNYLYHLQGSPVENIHALLNDILYVPVIDEQEHLLAIARRRTAKDNSLVISGTRISEDDLTYIIAEIGINHNGSLETARTLISLAADSGANAAKFQMRDMKSLYRKSGKNINSGEDLGAQYILDILSKFQLSTNEMFEAFDYCKEKGITPLCTPWDHESVVILEEYGMEAYKVASADLTNHDLLKALINTNKPIIISTGMSREEEIIESADLLNYHGLSFVALHCNSTYPAPFKDVNLKYLDRLKEITNGIVGYSGHERGYHVAVAAVARGAKVIEKHFTLDKNMEGNDHKVSLLPSEFSDMVTAIREVEESLGTNEERLLSQGELINRENLAKSLVAKSNIKTGEVIKENQVEIKSPGRGLQPNKKNKLIGLIAKRDISEGDFFYDSDIDGDIVTARAYKYKRPWGLPVRYHDYKNIIVDTNPDFIEFHLSYKDMELEYSQFFDKPMEMDYLVHSPDLFEGDHLLNLASDSKDYRQRSINELQRVIDVTRGLKKYFNKASGKIKIIVSLGGFSKTGPVSLDKRKDMYLTVADSLSQLDTEGVEILPQTLPPFPWYFGGQLYCNIFVDADDTVEFCKVHNYRLCFDVSHSKLVANQRKISFSEMVEKIAPVTGHLHIVDAEGVDGEGIQVGEGEIDFAMLGSKLNKYAPNISFIPEIWQGHKNNGEGFWIALERLEKYL